MSDQHTSKKPNIPAKPGRSSASQAAASSGQPPLVTVVAPATAPTTTPTTSVLSSPIQLRTRETESLPPSSPSQGGSDAAMLDTPPTPRAVEKRTADFLSPIPEHPAPSNEPVPIHEVALIHGMTIIQDTLTKMLEPAHNPSLAYHNRMIMNATIIGEIYACTYEVLATLMDAQDDNPVAQEGTAKATDAFSTFFATKGVPSHLRLCHLAQPRPIHPLTTNQLRARI